MLFSVSSVALCEKIQSMVTTRPHHPHLSIIVPVWGRDRDDVRDLIMHSGSQPGDGVEWIVAAAGDSGRLRELEAAGRIRLVGCADPSRGRQMNQGAPTASGTILCFNHVDTRLEPGHLAALLNMDDRIVGGAFHRRFDDRHRWMLRWEKIVHSFDRGFGPFFGDQSIFVRRGIFCSLVTHSTAENCSAMRASNSRCTRDPSQLSATRFLEFSGTLAE